MKSIIYLAGHLLLKLIDNGQVICYLLLRPSGYKAANLIYYNQDIISKRQGFTEINI